MEDQIRVQPLPHKTRKRVFMLLFLVFLVSLPFLYLYATGYRFSIKTPTDLIETGGLYIAVDRTGADIYIDGELVRETRTFRKAFYAQNIDAGTHRVHVQKDGYHTWVKELPVSKRLVTEAEAFNMPLVPMLRVISPYTSETGSPIVREPITGASTTVPVLATTTKSTKAFVLNEEFKTLMTHFGTTSTSTQRESLPQQIRDLIDTNKATSTEENVPLATTTITSNGVRLFEQGPDVYAQWVGNFEQMPYYYCAPDFPRYSSSTPTTTTQTLTLEEIRRYDTEAPKDGEYVMHPVQTLPKDLECDPTIRIDRKWQTASHFDFFPGNTDLVLMGLEDGIYVVEIDDRAWQNVQPLILGRDLRFYIEGGNVFVYDGTLIYQVMLETE